MLSLEDLFCHIDDFCQTFEPLWNTQLLEGGVKTRNRSSGLYLSERMRILIACHQMGYRTFKDFYQKLVQPYWHDGFPGLVSYSRFVQLLPLTPFPLCAYLRYGLGSNTGVSFIDSTKLKVCHHRRSSQHQTFSGQAARGCTSVDGFFGFKLHLVVNDRGELLNITLTPGNVDDREPVAQLVQRLMGKLFGDKGHKLFRIKTSIRVDYFSIKDKKMSAKNYLNLEQVEKLPKALKQEENGNIRERILILSLLNDGKTQKEIAKFLGCSQNKVCFWCVHGDPDNLESLKDDKMKGNHHKATEKYVEILLETIDKDPQELGYELGRWSTQRLATYLEKVTRMKLSGSQVWRILSKKSTFTFGQNLV